MVSLSLPFMSQFYIELGRKSRITFFETSLSTFIKPNRNNFFFDRCHNLLNYSSWQNNDIMWSEVSAHRRHGLLFCYPGV